MFVCTASTVSLRFSFRALDSFFNLVPGPIVRISPNEYSIDDPDAARIIYRTKDELVKVRQQARL